MTSAKTGASCLVAAVVLGSATVAEAADPPPIDVHHVSVPDDELEVHQPVPFPTPLWVLAQLVPSPEVAFGKTKEVDSSGHVDDTVRGAFGLRWQLTPALWSFGVHRSQPRWRFFVVDPLARQSGSIELSTSFEYIGGQFNGVIARPGVRVYFPLLEKGEKLSCSIGTSVYAADGFRVAYDAGLYVINGFFGLVVTVAPRHDPLETIVSLRLRYF